MILASLLGCPAPTDSDVDPSAWIGGLGAPERCGETVVAASAEAALVVAFAAPPPAEEPSAEVFAVEVPERVVVWLEPGGGDPCAATGPGAGAWVGVDGTVLRFVDGGALTVELHGVVLLGDDGAVAIPSWSGTVR